MKSSLIILTAINISAGTLGYCEEQAPKPVSVETDYGGDASTVSTDEIILNRDDGSKIFLTNNGCMERVPVISYDESAIAFLRRVDSDEDGVVNWNDAVELWVMRLGNRAESRVAAALSDPSQASWHPSKLRLTFIATDGADARGLYTYDIREKSLTLIAEGADSWPAWSLNGEYIAFYDSMNRVNLFNFKDKKTKILSEDVGNSWALYWTEDNRIVFSKEIGGWHIYSPGTESPRPLDDEEYKKLVFFDQAKFDWAGAANRKIKKQNKSEMATPRKPSD